MSFYALIGRRLVAIHPDRRVRDLRGVRAAAVRAGRSRGHARRRLRLEGAHRGNPQAVRLRSAADRAVRASGCGMPCNGDLGTSLLSSSPVVDLIAQRMPNTILIAIYALVISAAGRRSRSASSRRPASARASTPSSPASPRSAWRCRASGSRSCWWSRCRSTGTCFRRPARRRSSPIPAAPSSTRRCRRSRSPPP